MSRVTRDLPDGRVLLVGDDPPFKTWYAALFDSPADYPDDPSRCVGYHPAEQALDTTPQYGAYPADEPVLRAQLADWGLTGEQIDQAVRDITGTPHTVEPLWVFRI